MESIRQVIFCGSLAFFEVGINQGTIGCTPNVRVPMVYIVFNLGILGDNLPMNTHVI